MNARGLRRYVDDLLRGRRPKAFAPDDFEAAQIRTAIELRAARQGDADAPRPEFLDDLHRRLAEQMTGAPPEPAPMQNTTRRQVIVGTSAAAAAAVAAVSVDRAVIGDHPPNRRRRRRRRAIDAQHRNVGSASRPARTCRTGACILRPRLGQRIRPPRRRQARKPCPGCAPIKGAGCGSTRPTTGCAAHVTRRRSRPAARCSPINCRSHRSRCPR